MRPLSFVASLLQTPSPVSVTPTTSGLPGANLFQQLLNWLSQAALWGSLASLLIGAAIVGLPVEKAMQAQAAVAADRVRDSTVARIQQQLLALYAAAPPETLSYRVGVLAVHVVMPAPDEAHVQVWQVGTLFAPNAP